MRRLAGWLCLCTRGITFGQGLAGGHRLARGVRWGREGRCQESAGGGVGWLWRKTKFGRRGELVLGFKRGVSLQVPHSTP